MNHKEKRIECQKNASAKAKVNSLSPLALRIIRYLARNGTQKEIDVCSYIGDHANDVCESVIADLVERHKLIRWIGPNDQRMKCKLTAAGLAVARELEMTPTVYPSFTADLPKGALPWHHFFLSMAQLASTRSRDLSTKVGAVLVDCNNNVRGVGYNGFPRGVDDSVQARYQRPEKYLWTCHAEENVILSAARNGICTSGCTLYCTHAPCSRCARGIIQAGIIQVVVPVSGIIPTMQAELELGATMLREAKIDVLRLELS